MYCYIECVENIVCIVDVGLWMVFMCMFDVLVEWLLVLVSLGVDDGYWQKYDVYVVDIVIDYLLCDCDNLLSVLLCIEVVCLNVWMVCMVLMCEVWESVNGVWFVLCCVFVQLVLESELLVVFDQVKCEIVLIFGSFYSMMLCNEIFDFVQIGVFIECVDNIVWIIDVKYYLLLLLVLYVGMIFDNY